MGYERHRPGPAASESLLAVLRALGAELSDEGDAAESTPSTSTWPCGEGGSSQSSSPGMIAPCGRRSTSVVAGVLEASLPLMDRARRTSGMVVRDRSFSPVNLGRDRERGIRCRSVSRCRILTRGYHRLRWSSPTSRLPGRRSSPLRGERTRGLEAQESVPGAFSVRFTLSIEFELGGGRLFGSRSLDDWTGGWAGGSSRPCRCWHRTSMALRRS